MKTNTGDTFEVIECLRYKSKSKNNWGIMLDKVNYKFTSCKLSNKVDTEYKFSTFFLLKSEYRIVGRIKIKSLK